MTIFSAFFSNDPKLLKIQKLILVQKLFQFGKLMGLICFQILLVQNKQKNLVFAKLIYLTTKRVQKLLIQIPNSNNFELASFFCLKNYLYKLKP